MFMINKSRAAALAAVLLATTPAFAETMVKDVAVDVDLDSIQNAKAATQWSNLADDLENQIVARLVGRTADEGATISVRIDEVELANTLERMTGVADSKLTGHVKVDQENDASVADNYDLTVTFQDAGTLIMPGTDISTLTTNSKEYYDAMVGAFADHVVAKLK